MSVRWKAVLWAAAAAAAGPVAPVPAQTRDEALITAGTNTDTVWAYRAEPSYGFLSPAPGAPFPGERPVGLAIHPSNRFAYVSNTDSLTISGFAVDGTTGALAPLPGFPYAPVGDSSSLACEPTGRFLYAADDLYEEIRQYGVNPATGRLTYLTSLDFPLTMPPHRLAAHPSGRFLYALAQNSGVWALTIDPVTGGLAVIPGSPYIHTPGESMQSVLVHPSGRFVYATHGLADEVVGYRVDLANGALTLIPGAPFPTGADFPNGLAADSTGRFLYAANRYTIAAFAVDANTGALSLVPGSPFDARAAITAPVAHSSGRALYVLDLNNDRTLRFLVDPATGALTEDGWTVGGGRGWGAARTTFGDDLIFRNDFESADTGSWSGRTPAGFEVNRTAAYAGVFGLQVAVANTTVAYVQDDSPFQERRYRARFYVNLTGLAMAEGDEFDLLRAFNSLGPPRFRVALVRSAGVNRVRLIAAQDDESLLTTTLALTAALAPGWRAIEVDWQAASATGANDGALRLWVDEVAAPSLTGIDNDLSRIDLVTWGAVAALEPTTAGTFLLDTFESRRWSHIGWALVFDDVPFSHPFWRFVHAVHAWGVTTGCGPRVYCPDTAVTREQMAVFLVRSREDPGYTPPGCADPPFFDVPASSPFCPWIQALWMRQVTGGCVPGFYCPTAPVARAQMAVLLLRALEGPGYTAPPCSTAPFSDVPAADPFCPWIQELVRRGITGGCGGGRYCPETAVTRGEMAVFLTRTFGLPVP